MALSITKLPKELLALIFEHLTKANDRRRAAQTCKLFYDIIRHQSTLKRDNMLRMKGSDSDKSPIRVLENSAFFPFSKLYIEHFDNNITLEHAFWSLHGPKISEIIFDDETVYMEPVLSTLNKYFPNLKKLKIKSRFSQSLDANNSENVLLPIEDLIIVYCWIMPLDQVLALLRCSPLLKKLKINNINADYLPQILPWFETIDNFQLNFEDKMPLEKLISLPSKVIVGELRIKVDETPKKIREFFKNRTIEQLTLERFDEDAPIPIYFTREQALALSAANSIKKVHLYDGVLEFEGSLDFLARLPGVESISFNFSKDQGEDILSPLYPFYWSLPGTAQKIHSVCQYDVANLHYLAGLSSVTSISVWESSDTMSRGLSSEEIQILIHNCPNLKSLDVLRIDATDADLSGHGDLLPISFLEKLEILYINSAPNITSEAFKSAFKLPKLKYFVLDYGNSSEEKPFNQDVAKQFIQNSPNLEMLKIGNCPINEEGFDYLIRHLPYLQHIAIGTKRGHQSGHSLNKSIVKEMQKEFPYVKIELVACVFAVVSPLPLVV